MKKLIIPSLCLFLYLPVVTNAQNWTTEQKEVLDNIEMCWDAWIEAIEKKDVEVFFSKCPSAENTSMWWTENGFPSNNRNARRDFDRFIDIDVKWVDLQPAAILIHGDVAIAQFYGIWRVNTPEGQKNTEYKRTEIFKKINGRWVFLGGQGTPSSTKDMNAYN